MCVYVCVCVRVEVFVGVCVCGCGVLICFVSTLGSHEMGRHKLPIIIIIITTHHASWRIGQQESSSTPSVTGQPLDGAPAVVHVLHFRSHSFSPGCF